MNPQGGAFPPARTVREGAHLRVIAPAGPFDRESFEEGIHWLRLRYRVSFSDDIFHREGYFAGKDERRLEELNEAIRDPSVDAILCARGGFGCTRLLPRVDAEAIRSANKSIIGFSDVTALHALWARAGVRSIHAPMVAGLGKAPPGIREVWRDIVERRVTVSRWQLEEVNPGMAETGVSGRFFGGNLAVLGALAGTPFVPPLEDVILFLEDVGERPYRVDRILTTLSHAGWFENIRGLILGAFTEGAPGEDGVATEQVFEDHFGAAPFPVLRGFPAGHIEENFAMELGGEARIQKGRLELID